MVPTLAVVAMIGFAGGSLPSIPRYHRYHRLKNPVEVEIESPPDRGAEPAAEIHPHQPVQEARAHAQPEQRAAAPELGSRTGPGHVAE